MLISRFLSFIVFVVLSVNLVADGIVGFWETLDDDTKKPSSVIAIYPYQGKFYGRIVAIYNKAGVLDDTIDHPLSKAPGVKGNPYYVGLDIVWDVSPPNEDQEYNGEIVDPKEGKIYKAKLMRSGKDLILRGEVFIFGENKTWPPFPESGFTSDFKKPDVATFVPKKPDVD